MKVNVKYGQRSRHRPRPRGPGMAPQPHRAGLAQGPGHAARDATWSHTWSDLTCIPHTCQSRSCSSVQHYIHLHALDPNQRRIHDLGPLVGLKLEMLSLSIVNNQDLTWSGLAWQVQEIIWFHLQRLQDYAFELFTDNLYYRVLMLTEQNKKVEGWSERGSWHRLVGGTYKSGLWIHHIII